MFVHVVTLYSVHAEAADNFVLSIRSGGDWHRIARRVAPDLVASDLLQHQSSPTPVFLCIDFWVSREMYLRVRESAVYESLFNLRNQLAQSSIQLGEFAFPARHESDTVLSQIAETSPITDKRVAR
jgi:hypothetical protein